MNKEIERLLQSLKDERAEINEYSHASKHVDDDRESDINRLNILISALEAQQSDRWIPVTSGKLPEKEKPVLTCDKYGNIHIINHIKGYRHPFNISPENERYHEPVAWKPLPKPWKEE